ncbi:MAG: SH3 domain-containing protein [Chloroflexota bacterium]
MSHQFTTYKQTIIPLILLAFGLLACNFVNQFGTTPEIGPPPTIISSEGQPTAVTERENGVEATAVSTSDPNIAPTATLPPQTLSLTTLVPANTRTGPSTLYDVIEQFPEGETATIVGQNEDGTWWAIEHPAGINGRGWIFAELVSVNGNSLGVPILPDPPQLSTERVEYKNENGRYRLEHSPDLIVLPDFGTATSEQQFATTNATSPQQLPLGDLWLAITVEDNSDENPLSDWADQFPTPEEVRSITVDGNPAIQQVEDARDEETGTGQYALVTYIAHEERVITVRAITTPALPNDDPFVHYQAEYDAMLASLKLLPNEPEALDFDIAIEWRLDPNDTNEAIATVTITARGGDGDYIYFRDGSLRQDGSVFEYRWRSCSGNPVSFQVEDSSGQRASQDRFEQTPCP